MSIGRLLPLLLAGAICMSGGMLELSSASADTAQTTEVFTDLDGALAMARNGLAIGRPDVTVSIARQILAVKPDDAAAHMLLAAGLTRSGGAVLAIPVAKAGFRLADGKEARFEGAYLTAEAMAAAGRPWAAKLWLRKADLYAPTDQHEAVLAQAYRQVSAQSRLGFAVSLFGGPSDNVNGGSLHDTFWFFGFPIAITEALPGQVFGGSAQLSYTLSDRTQARVLLAHKEVFLGDRARAIDPTARGRDYRQNELSFGLNHVWRSEDGRFAVLGSGSLGRRWTGGDVSSDMAAVGVELRHAPSTDWALSGKLAVDAVDIPGTTTADSVTSRLSFGASHLNKRFGAMTVELGAVDVASDAAGIAWRGPSLTLGWRPPIQSENVGLTLNLAVENRDYWRTPSFDPDTWASLSVTAELPVWEVMGFNPTVTVTTARTLSDLVVRDTRELGVSFGLSSSF